MKTVLDRSPSVHWFTRTAEELVVLHERTTVCICETEVRGRLLPLKTCCPSCKPGQNPLTNNLQDMWPPGGKHDVQRRQFARSDVDVMDGCECAHSHTYRAGLVIFGPFLLFEWVSRLELQTHLLETGLREQQIFYLSHLSRKRWPQRCRT